MNTESLDQEQILELLCSKFARTTAGVKICVELRHSDDILDGIQVATIPDHEFNLQQVCRTSDPQL